MIETIVAWQKYKSSRQIDKENQQHQIGVIDKIIIIIIIILADKEIERLADWETKKYTSKLLVKQKHIIIYNESMGQLIKKKLTEQQQYCEENNNSSKEQQQQYEQQCKNDSYVILYGWLRNKKGFVMCKNG